MKRSSEEDLRRDPEECEERLLDVGGENVVQFW
jgi:hypothetical protein